MDAKTYLLIAGLIMISTLPTVIGLSYILYRPIKIHGVINDPSFGKNGRK